MTDPVNTIPEFARNSVNLASPRLGSQAVLASDEFFAAKERMLQDSKPVFIADKYDDNGKWMDGWESRRRRVTSRRAAPPERPAVDGRRPGR